MTKSEVLKRLRDNRVTIKDQFHADIVAIFGSYARGDHSIKSDLDVLYRLETSQLFGLKEIEGLENYLKVLVNVPAVDLVNEDYVNPIVKLEIEDELEYV